ncbi:Putative two component transcriptional regulator,winged helix family [Micromonospora lupini str. Lupac 08]|uniref:Putative two component transcriptional regulator,winged helix family n=1 Tax=Micromonospora lupini str. Lupac 08 TaxID=1150864 RepID=I0L3J5_9ACTN|nr:Putative two component transcriptional regulator,winged helix family [Micromonospora lupini str. Lupac 08]
MSVVAIPTRPYSPSHPGRAAVRPRTGPTLTITLDLAPGPMSPRLARLVQLLGELAESGEGRLRPAEDVPATPRPLPRPAIAEAPAADTDGADVRIIGRHPGGPPRRPGGRADPHRVRPAALPRRAPAPGLHPPPAAVERLGLRTRRGPHRGRARPTPAGQAARGGGGHDRLRGRLPAGRRGADQRRPHPLSSAPTAVRRRCATAR